MPENKDDIHDLLVKVFGPIKSFPKDIFDILVDRFHFSPDEIRCRSFSIKYDILLKNLFVMTSTID